MFGIAACKLLGQQQAAGVVLVRAVAVARLAGDEDDSLGLLPRSIAAGLAAALGFVGSLGAAAKLLDPEIAELHRHRRPGVQLQGEEPLVRPLGRDRCRSDRPS